MLECRESRGKHPTELSIAEPFRVDVTTFGLHKEGVDLGCHTFARKIGGGRAKGKAVFTNGHNIIVLEAVPIGIVPGIQEIQVMQDMPAEGDPTNKICR